MPLALFAEIVVGTGAFIAALTAIWKWLGIGKLHRGIDDFLHDWNGEPPRDGYPGRPSFPARLTNLEKEFKPNGGGSLRDLANQAKVRAEDAADASAEIAAALGRADAVARDERAVAAAKIDALANALDFFARDQRQRERRYVEALLEVADIDLTGVTEDLNDQELEGE